MITAYLQWPVRRRPFVVFAVFELSWALFVSGMWPYLMWNFFDDTSRLVLALEGLSSCEFTASIFLRAEQVKLVEQCVSTLRAGRSLVSQMIMGAGKTSTILPLLALLR